MATKNQYRFIVLETRMVSGVVYVYGFLDTDAGPSINSRWYRLSEAREDII